MKKQIFFLLYIILAACILSSLTSCAAFGGGTVHLNPDVTPGGQSMTTADLPLATSGVPTSTSGASVTTPKPAVTFTTASSAALPDESGSYTTKEDVALYIHTFRRLPGNFITKSEARALGWDGGALEDYAPGKCIGGDRFGNYEGLLPNKSGRSYTECDIDTLGKSSRGTKRIVFSNDGLIYYTDDHYESFTLLFGEEDK